MGLRPPPPPPGLGGFFEGAKRENDAILKAIRAGELLRSDIFAQEEAWTLGGGGETFSEWRARLELEENAQPWVRGLGALVRLGRIFPPNIEVR
jgi:hypothetical protein